MRRRLASLTAALLTALITAPATAQPYAIDPAHAFVTFTADHLGFSIVHGQFLDFSADIDFDPANVEATQVRFTVKTASVETYNKTRDDQLRSATFFDSAKYPEMVFRSTAVQPTGVDTAEISGDLTIRGITKPVKLEAKLNRLAPSPFFPDITVAGFTVTGTLDRTEWGMTFGAPAIGVQVPIQLDFEMSPRT